MVVISVGIHGVKIILKFRWKVVFLRGVPWNPPLCTNGSAGYLMQLSVNNTCPNINIEMLLHNILKSVKSRQMRVYHCIILVN